ncbi:hypothetical protein AYK24_02450 [Thermoplasmatales archaeon SG8-52-4]|nr:MAG: hypothetical protein AYK24_02450 [Thermoplasmatales archaeon SG8-52-4]
MKWLNKYEKQIIELLVQNDKTLSEISAGIGISKPATSKYLNRLEENNLIKGKYEINSTGRSIKYSLQPFQLLLSIDPFNKLIISFKADESLDTSLLYLGYIQQKEFRKDVREYLDKIIKSYLKEYLVILYGSVAQGIGTRKSDIDLLFLKNEWSEKEMDEILDLLANASNSCNHKAKPLFKEVNDFENMGNSFQKQIKEHGIIIYEKGKQWNKIKNQLKRYKIITI